MEVQAAQSQVSFGGAPEAAQWVVGDGLEVELRSSTPPTALLPRFGEQ